MIDIFSTFLLGLVVIIHPCTSVPNLAAMTYLYGKSEKKSLVLWMYIIGHSLLYVVLGTALTLMIKEGIIVISKHTEMQWAVPFLVTIFAVAGLLLIYSAISNHHHHEESHAKMLSGLWGAFVSGVLLALAFCPEGAVAFFGVLLPMSVASTSGLILPTVFAVATAIPIAVVAVLMQNGIAIKQSHLNATRWFNLALGVLFIITAIVLLVF